MKKNINVFCVADDNYVPYCGIMLTSVFENNPECAFSVFVFVSHPLKDSNVAQFEKLEKLYGQKIQFVFVDTTFLKGLPLLRGNIPLTTFYRLYVAELLPESIEKILYLDDDMVVTGDLSPIWEMDMADKVVAAVPDVISPSGEHQKRLHYPVEAGYFNAGVIMINLRNWRMNNIGQQCLAFLEDHHDILRYYDQDVLNAVLWDKKITLPHHYNFQTQVLARRFFDTYSVDLQKEITESAKKTLVIHYSGPLKPWSVVYYGLPFQEEWRQYQKRSIWSDLSEQVPKNKKLNWILKRYIMWPLGLIKNDAEYIRLDK